MYQCELANEVASLTLRFGVYTKSTRVKVNWVDFHSQRIGVHLRSHSAYQLLLILLRLLCFIWSSATCSVFVPTGDYHMHRFCIYPICSIIRYCFRVTTTQPTSDYGAELTYIDEIKMPCTTKIYEKPLPLMLTTYKELLSTSRKLAYGVVTINPILELWSSAIQSLSSL
jgi:hypothetical protein